MRRAASANNSSTSKIQSHARFGGVSSSGFGGSGVFSGGCVNMESVETMATAGTSRVQLYFPAASGRMLVPVTRTVFSDADVTTAILELAKGPRQDSGLTAPLPAGQLRAMRRAYAQAGFGPGDVQ